MIFYRYAQDQGWDVSAWTDLGLYQDAAQVSDYATQALAWACGAGLITGTTDTTLSPRGSATRAQVAVILTRFCETVMPDGPVSHQEMVRNLQNSSLRKRDTWRPWPGSAGRWVCPRLCGRAFGQHHRGGGLRPL